VEREARPVLAGPGHLLEALDAEDEVSGLDQDFAAGTFVTTLAPIPGDTPYLRACSTAVEQCRSRFASLTPPSGLVVSLVSPQKDANAEDRALLESLGTVEDCSRSFADFGATAALESDSPAAPAGEARRTYRTGSRPRHMVTVLVAVQDPSRCIVSSAADLFRQGFDWGRAMAFGMIPRLS
jgi:hypothetical protein